MPDVDTSTPGLQTSNKSGKHSSAEKLAASRPEFGEWPRRATRRRRIRSTMKKGEHQVTGRLARVPAQTSSDAKPAAAISTLKRSFPRTKWNAALAKAATPAGRNQ